MPSRPARFGQRKSPPRKYGRTHQALRLQVLARDNYRCVECGSTEQLQAGHIDRLGPDALWNYKTQCKPCNLRQAQREARGAGSSGSPKPRPMTNW